MTEIANAAAEAAMAKEGQARAKLALDAAIAADIDQRVERGEDKAAAMASAEREPSEEVLSARAAHFASIDEAKTKAAKAQDVLARAPKGLYGGYVEGAAAAAAAPAPAPAAAAHRSRRRGARMADDDEAEEGDSSDDVKHDDAKSSSSSSAAAAAAADGAAAASEFYPFARLTEGELQRLSVPLLEREIQALEHEYKGKNKEAYALAKVRDTFRLRVYPVALVCKQHRKHQTKAKLPTKPPFYNPIPTMATPRGGRGY